MPFPECSSSEPLGMYSGRIRDNQITASSHAPGYPAYKARTRGYSCWRSADNTLGEFLEINLGEKRHVKGIFIQGDPLADNWTEQLFLAYSLGSGWENVTSPHQGHQAVRVSAHFGHFRFTLVVEDEFHWVLCENTLL